MDTISSATSISAANAQSLSSSGSESPTAITSDFETFLKMMTAQIQNQDPLNPLDASDFATQLATFSGVEQQVKTNDLLTNLLQQSGALDMSRMANWVGQTVRVAATATYEGTPISVWAAPLDAADHAELVVRDAFGRERNRISIPATESPVEWTGIDSRGAAVAWGDYTLDVESYDADGTLLGAAPAEIYADVLEARIDGASIRLVLPGGVEVDSSSVTAIRGSE
mgnify:CR=1 FL=1